MAQRLQTLQELPLPLPNRDYIPIFDYYELAHAKEGISGGLNYNKVQHVTLGSIANNESPQQERPLVFY